MNRVVITGIGCRTPLGNNYQTVRDSFLNGTKGSKVDQFDSSAYVVDQLTHIDQHFDRYDLNITDRFTRLAWLSYKDAIFDSNNYPEGIFLGVGYGGGALAYEEAYRSLFAKGKVKPTALVCSVVNMGANFIALKDQIKGPAITYSTACSSSSTAIGEAYKKIAYGEHKVLVAGGSEACINQLQFAYWKAMGALSSDCKPFSKNRDGITMSEGSVIFVLEEYNSAVNRGAKIYCEIVGYGISNGSESVTKPNVEGQVQCMKQSIKDFELSDVTYINAHGTGTQMGDLVELQSIEQLFGSHTNNIPVSSTKSLHGHLFGAAGAIETLACITSLETNSVIPNWHLDQQDPTISLNIILPISLLNKKQNVVLNNSFGFGGTNVTLAYKKLDS
jgi:3-oxoacyl-[acyl-carrier-protein] synthase II